MHVTVRRLLTTWVAITIVVVAVAVWALCADRSVQHGLARLDVRMDRIVSIEVFEQDHCCGGPKADPITLQEEQFSSVFSALRRIDRSSAEGGCACGTNGTQILIHLCGDPSIAQITYTGCGYFVLHDGSGAVLSYFESKALHTWLQEYYWSRKSDAN